MAASTTPPHDLSTGLVPRDGELRRAPAELASIAHAATAACVEHLTGGDSARGHDAATLASSTEARRRGFHIVPEVDTLDAAIEAARTLKPLLAPRAALTRRT